MLNLFFLIFIPFLTLGSTDHDYGSWNSLILVKPVSNNNQFSFEHEIRYSDEQDGLSQEQSKFLFETKLKKNNILGFGFNHRYGGAYSKTTERRYLVQYANKILTGSKLGYDLRFRFELRDFTGNNRLAQRFRVRNLLNLLIFKYKKWQPSVSSEFNFYINDNFKFIK